MTFTSLADWTTSQDTEAANEIVLAYSERRQAIRQSAVSALVSGDNAQDTTFWLGMQRWCETVVSASNHWQDRMYYLDHTVTIEGIGQCDFPFYTLAAFRYNSGLIDGFRRATTWPTDWTDYADAAYSYGTIQSGDIIGPWIYEDLQKALDSFKKTGVKTNQADASGGDTAQLRFVSCSSGETYAAALADATTKWGSTSWFNISACCFYKIQFEISAGESSYSIHSVRYRHADTITDLPTFAAHTANGWLRNVVAGTYSPKLANDADYPADVFTNVQVFASATTATRTIPTDPNEDLPEPNTYTVPTYPDPKLYMNTTTSQPFYDFTFAFTYSL